MFNAIQKGEHTDGIAEWKWKLDSMGHRATTQGSWFKMSAAAVADGADLRLEITNTTDHDWPEISAIIPCFNPGFDDSKKTDAIPNPDFFDEDHNHTYFIGEDGLELLKGGAPREIHFNQKWQRSIASWKKERDDGKFVWHLKWPTSNRNAYQGAIIRESKDRTQVMAIVWEDFLSAQGHNPWKCMHLSVRVGALKRGESKTVRGKAYLFDGTKEDFLKRMETDFSLK